MSTPCKSNDPFNYGILPRYDNKNFEADSNLSHIFTAHMFSYNNRNNCNESVF